MTRPWAGLVAEVNSDPSPMDGADPGPTVCRHGD